MQGAVLGDARPWDKGNLNLTGVTDTDLTGKLKEVTADTSRLMTTEAIENALKFALTVPANVCPLEIAVINQQTPWTAPVIPFKQEHPDK